MWNPRGKPISKANGVPKNWHKAMLLFIPKRLTILSFKSDAKAKGIFERLKSSPMYCVLMLNLLLK